MRLRDYGAMSVRPPHGRIAHLYERCGHLSCLDLRYWLCGDRPLDKQGRPRVAGAPWAERSAWHLRKPSRRPRGERFPATRTLGYGR